MHVPPQPPHYIFKEMFCTNEVVHNSVGEGLHKILGSISSMKRTAKQQTIPGAGGKAYDPVIQEDMVRQEDHNRVQGLSELCKIRPAWTT